MTDYFLSLDMTLRNTGWAAYAHKNGLWLPEKLGLIQTMNKKGKVTHYQMEEDCRAGKEVYIALQDVIDTYDPVLVVVERLGGTQGAKAARTFGVVEGVFAALMESNEIPHYLISADEAKETLTGDRSASKAKMVDYAERHYKDLCEEYLPKGTAILKRYCGKAEHMADAIAIAEYSKRQSEIRAILKMAVK